MPPSLLESPSFADAENLAQVVDRLGGIPLDRIVWKPFPGTATEADQIRYVDGDDKRLVELLDGILVEKAMGLRESFLASWIATCLNNFVVPRKLGLVSVADGLVRLFPGLVRIPDVAYFPLIGFDSPRDANRAIGTVAPALAVEIRSATNTRKELEKKTKDYFRAGTQIVWLVQPASQTVQVYTALDTSVVLKAPEVLDGGRLLPGFHLPVADLFGYLPADSED